MTTQRIPEIDPAAFWTPELVLILAGVAVLMAWVLWDVIAGIGGDDE